MRNSERAVYLFLACIFYAVICVFAGIGKISFYEFATFAMLVFIYIELRTK